MAGRIEVYVLGIAGSILPAQVADVVGRDIATVVDRPVGDVDQVERGREDEGLGAGELPVVPFGHTNKRMGRRVIGVDPLGEEGVDPDRIERQRRRGRQAVLLRTVHARSGPQYTRKLLKRECSGIVFAPRTAVVQRLIDRQARLEVGFHQGDPLAVGHLGPGFGLLPALLSGRASACREQQRRACQHVSFHIVTFF